VLAAAAVGLVMVQLDFFALNLALPRMAQDLDVQTTDLQWVISGYMLALASFLIPGGRLGDILGRRPVLIAGLAIFATASAVCGAASSPNLVIGFRVLQGIGAAIMFPLCVAVVTNAFPEERRARAIGNLYGLGAVATAVGPFVGGVFTDALTWRWVFLINIPLGIAAIAMVLAFVRESRDETVARHIDLRGLAAVTTGIAAVTLAVDRGQEWGWTSVPVIAVFACGLALLYAFVTIERRVSFPLVDLDLFRNRPYVVVTLMGTVGNVVFVTTTFCSALYLQQVRGLSPIAAGAVFLAASVATSVAGPLSGRLGERFFVPRVMMLSMIAGFPGLIVVALDPSLGIYMAALVVFGFGYGLTWSIVSVGTQAVVPVEQAGEASGITLAMVIGLAGLAVAIAAAVIEALVAGGTSEASAIKAILITVACASVLIGVALGLLANRFRVPAPSVAT
jgi:EmrB/QacA subfamily drug resistance transporter